ncbi:NAD(+) synthase [Spiroplasma endosymbiont of Othius punctulatus]|uniref:NAD(+) synthase n=1 Tax=Spiroplasma endosymbiont of Othius punctulatus TaxID=3066289 RepID=UPI0030D59C1A
MKLKEYINYLSDWVKEEVKKANAEGVIIGLSGGIDSAVVACIAQKAFPKDHLTVWINCESPSYDYTCAQELIKLKNFNSINLNLTGAYQQLIEEIGSNASLSGIARANTKSRLRMTTLYSIAQSKNYLVLGTDNADEWHIGYFTKHGDGAADLLPIVHLLKREVKEAAQILEVNEEIINRAPSAGLWDNQTDEKEIGVTYKVIDDYLSGKRVDSTSKKRIEHLNKITEHKRVTAPKPNKMK